MRISVIIPVLNEAAAINTMLPELQWMREAGHELIVVDGGSDDDSAQVAQDCADQVITSRRGRARQMNAGAQVACGDVLLFLHIDTGIAAEGIASLRSAFSPGIDGWGRFDVRLSGSRRMFRLIETMMNWRSRLTGIATGDQAIFVSRSLFVRSGGYADIPLMEDIELCRRLRRISKPRCLPKHVTTSSRRWENNGILNTVLLMWRLRLAYWLGVDPAALVRRYYG
jgi:rSAM/selenodomain-associated transferase 2